MPAAEKRVVWRKHLATLTIYRIADLELWKQPLALAIRWCLRLLMPPRRAPCASLATAQTKAGCTGDDGRRRCGIVERRAVDHAYVVLLLCRRLCASCSSCGGCGCGSARCAARLQRVYRAVRVGGFQSMGGHVKSVPRQLRHTCTVVMIDCVVLSGMSNNITDRASVSLKYGFLK